MDNTGNDDEFSSVDENDYLSVAAGDASVPASQVSALAPAAASAAGDALTQEERIKHLENEVQRLEGYTMVVIPLMIVVPIMVLVFMLNSVASESGDCVRDISDLRQRVEKLENQSKRLDK